MSNFLARAGAVKDFDMRRQESNAIINELARNPQLRELGWAISKKPLAKWGSNLNTLSVGDWYTNNHSIVDKSIREKTDRILAKLGWARSLSSVRGRWAYQKVLSKTVVFIHLTWRLGSALNTGDGLELGKKQYPIKYMEIYVDDGMVS